MTALDAAPPEDPPPHPYDDVPEGSWYAKAVEELHGDGVFAGTVSGDPCPAGFCPAAPVDRKTAMVWIARMLEEHDPPPATSRFADVNGLPSARFWAPFIDRMNDLGVVEGCGGDDFCPDHPVTRHQVAVFLARAFGLPGGRDPGFTDVPDDPRYTRDIARLAHAGITSGCGEGTTFCPDVPATRAEMATFLHRISAHRAREVTVVVHACGPSHSRYIYDPAYVDRLLEDIQRYVDGFFREQSGYDRSGGRLGIRFTFTKGEPLTPTIDQLGKALYWDNQYLSAWLYTAGNDPCVEAALTEHTPDGRFLILADVALGDAAGYNLMLGELPVVVATPNNMWGYTYPYTFEQYSAYEFFLETIAHELGHSLGLDHPWALEPAFDPRGFTDEEITAKLGPELAGSMMNYLDYGAKADLRRDAPESRRAYLACAHLAQAGWAERVNGRCWMPPVPPVPPDDPPRVTTGEGGRLFVEWDEPATDGGSPITAYMVRYRAERGGPWIRGPDVEGGRRRTTLKGLAGDIPYQVQVASVNRIGESLYSAYGVGAPR